MATTLKEKVTVTELSKYGFKSGEEYINFGKLIKESDKGKVVPGAVLEAEMYVADSGKRYLNAVLSMEHKQTGPSLKVEVKQAPKSSFVAKAKDEGMTKAEWSAKDRSQLIGGLSHDAATLVAALMAVTSSISCVDDAIQAHKKVLQGLITNRDEVK